MHHSGPGLGIDVLTQPGRVAGQREGSCRAWGDDPAPVGQLSAGGAPQPPAGHRQPLDQRAARDRNPGDRGSEHPDWRGDEEQGTAAAVERGHEARPADTEGDQLGQRQAEQDAAPGEAGELHGHQLAAAFVRRFSVRHRRSLLRRLGFRRRWWRGTVRRLRQRTGGRRCVGCDRSLARLLGTGCRLIGLTCERLARFRPGGRGCFDHGGTGHDSCGDRSCRRYTTSGRTARARARTAR
ncbi:hypothetical protein QP028_03050 [Corynebacterium suedekumii]|nr:hypothetical protein QP028_03050 [Corynebacterium suedekumii]